VAGEQEVMLRKSLAQKLTWLALLDTALQCQGTSASPVSCACRAGLVPASLLRKAPFGEAGIPCQTLMGLG
jgi:hypothetical protein